MNDDENDELGPCCICERTTGVHAIIALDVKGQEPGHGWGCVVCAILPDGVIAGIGILLYLAVVKWR